MSTRGVPVSITYITGNHDWLVNRYPETRALAAKFLQLDADGTKRFADQQAWDKYGVFARHGDVYDEFNYDGNRDASSIGDAIVIELLNKFPAAVAAECAGQVSAKFIDLLKEIDNVRPLLDAPLWVVAACEQVSDTSLSDKIHGVWDSVASKFLANPFVRRHDDLFSLSDPYTKLEGALLLSERLKLGPLSRILESPVLKVLQGQSDLIKRAANEDIFRSGQADFIVYGHTHDFGIWPIGKVITSGKTVRQSYINTGTWRKVFEHGTGGAFSGWNVMTFVCFYDEEERGDYLFETWNGSLA
jgi:UDP-2,3-diacylglucosamine pyrophosphatase LpxH